MPRKTKRDERTERLHINVTRISRERLQRLAHERSTPSQRVTYTDVIEQLLEKAAP